ncbi:hypothetical protein GCM10010357_03780 [Streptomyces luteireticuli]|uniref:Uncharacterized protein n=1 Tax=Streptomyces luteireticuli TaxID=173858 RepID=A0ABP3I0F4_9ACTN
MSFSNCPITLRQKRAEALALMPVGNALASTADTSAAELLEPFLQHGLSPYRLTNSYMPEDYPVMLRRWSVPTRLHGPITSQTDVVLSPIDSAELA